MVGNATRKKPARLGAFLWCLLSLFTLAPSISPSPAQSKEYQIKAAFLLNFAQFVTWPANAFSSADAPFVIGILGDDPFRAALDQTVEGENIDKRKIVIQRGQDIRDLKDCQMLFVGLSEGRRLAAVLAQVRSAPILTVSEIPGFARQGGVIGFYAEGAKVRFEINPSPAQRAGLKINSQLLNLGKIVDSQKEEPR